MSPQEELLLNKIIYSSFLIPLFLSALLIWLVVVFFKRKHKMILERKDTQIREQELRLSKEQELNNERNRIAAEMHDELGGGLTAIRYLGHRAKKNLNTEKAPEIIDKMMDNSSRLINNMSEIIWAMNSHYDSLESLISFIRSYTKRFCQDCELQYQEIVPDVILEQIITGKARRNIFLVLKEALNNIAKHADARLVIIEIKIGKQFSVSIKDDGKGLDEEKNAFSNGLRNMKQRMNDIKGSFDIKSNSSGTTIEINFPLNQMNE